MRSLGRIPGRSRRLARRPFSLLVTTAILFALQTLPAAADKRVALLVGNGVYAHASHLENPANDAEDMAAALKELNFDVVSGINLDKSAFDDKLRQFSRALAGADVGLFFYAGHGLQAKGVNHLIPVDATIANDYDLQLESVTLDSILTLMDQAKTRIVILDACRNNPFARTLARSTNSRGINEDLGLAMSVASGLGTFIAYATQPGNVASDGNGRNSPFTGPLKLHITEPGVSVTDLMILVRHDVVTATDGKQVPWDHSALLGKFYFSEGQAIQPDAAMFATGEAAQAWGWIKNTSDPAILEEFIRRYGSTTFGTTAKQRLAELRPRPAESPAPVIANLSAASLRPMQPSYDCKVHYKDAEVAICNNPELSMLDNELERLYSRALRGLAGERGQVLLGAQRQWLEARNACSTDVGCISKQYRARIKQLGASASPGAGAGAGISPSFDCAKHFLPAEVAICNDEGLTRLDLDLDRFYSRTSRRLSATRRKSLIVEQRQWLQGRDTCGSNRDCIKLQYEARRGQLETWN